MDVVCYVTSHPLYSCDNIPVRTLVRGIRGGLSQCSHRHAQANNKYMESYDPSKLSSYLMYYDVNNLYGWAMCHPLPYAEFRWVNDISNFDVNAIAPDSSKEYVLEVDLEYPQHLHDAHADLPFCPARDKLPGKRQDKLLATLYDKKRYVIHYRNLQQCTRHGLRIIKVHRVLEFVQSPWLRDYIELNTRFRAAAKNDFEKNLYKLMNNAVFGKTMKNVRNHVDVKLLTKWNGKYGAEAMIAKPNFHSRSIFSENLIAIEMRKLEVKFNKPIYVGMCILDISKGKLTIKELAANKHVVLENNCVAFMFDKIRYELNGVDIDRSRNVGITSTLKNYVSLTTSRNRMLKNAGWDIVHFSNGEEGHFNFCIPLSMLLGFCEDYRRVVINARHELILIRSRNDNNCLKGDAEIQPEIELLKSTTKHSWTVKATTQLEKPRYVIFALQTGRKINLTRSITRFDDCKLTNVKLYLNSEFYPYDDMNLDFGKKRYAILYDMYSRFYKSYYGGNHDEVLLPIDKFGSCGPFVVIDCSRQSESVKTATVDVRLEFDCMEDIPANTTAYCLILHDRVVEYSPLTNVVRKTI
ncbi:hypothetical protein DMN91_010566 [Ooceraea biroi]|uniref:DNA-directed DNA polymerase n=1 Tax=Ooceraea biroi TaxID=2015173 RepID=A0A3L8D9B7_OOCBI|nr:hypothetical protein DMN91_010566 [Ooceraea biroi]